jgi:adenosylcobinamide amidohydrolase
MFAEITSRQEDRVERDILVWSLPGTMLAASTALSGGGLGPRDWIINAQVASDYQRTDIQQHVKEMTNDLGLEGPGIAMLTAARVRRRQQVHFEGVDAEVTVGLSHPTWAASDDDPSVEWSVAGTVNIVVFVPVRLEEAALLNVLATATEAKSQALWDANIPGTGTASDAVCVLCSLAGTSEYFGGPRSLWGSRVARAVHLAVLDGAREWSS